MSNNHAHFLMLSSLSWLGIAFDGRTFPAGLLISNEIHEPRLTKLNGYLPKFYNLKFKYVLFLMFLNSNSGSATESTLLKAPSPAGVMSDEIFLTMKEAATYIKVSISKMQKISSSRIIPVYKPTGGKVYFRQSDLIKYLTQKVYYSHHPG